MGYTHYWERPRVLPRPQFVAAVEDCRRLCAALDIPLGNANGQNTPIFTSSRICFNGHVDSGRLSSKPQGEGAIPLSHGSPTAAAGILRPNGDGSYETFLVERVRHPRHPMEQAANGCGFCKTDYRPYDLCVTGCLIVLNHHLGQFRVDSDGDSQQWNPARDACQRVLGYGIDWGEDKLAPVLNRPPGPPFTNHH